MVHARPRSGPPATTLGGAACRRWYQADSRSAGGSAGRRACGNLGSAMRLRGAPEGIGNPAATRSRQQMLRLGAALVSSYQLPTRVASGIDGGVFLLEAEPARAPSAGA